MGPRTGVIYNAIQHDIHEAWRDDIGKVYAEVIDVMGINTNAK